VTLGRSRERLLRRISTRKGREAERVVLLEGPRVVETAVVHGAEILFGVVESGERGGAVERAIALLGQRGVEISELSPEAFRNLAETDSPQGLLAVAREPHVPGPPADLGTRVLVLDRLQDPGNVGTLIRAAAGLGVDRVLALDGTADPWSAKAMRASAGLAFKLRPLALGWNEAREWIEGSRLPLVVADAAGEDVREWLGRSAPGVGYALVVANEAAGPRPEVVEAARTKLAVPLSPGVESLNVGAAGAVLMWALGPGRASSGRSEGAPR
jgi:TrmH family RNA methyltransferase